VQFIRRFKPAGLFEVFGCDRGSLEPECQFGRNRVVGGEVGRGSFQFLQDLGRQGKGRAL